MASLLPIQTRSKLRWQRRVRTMTVVTFAATVGLLIAAASLLPFYVYSNIILEEVKIAQDDSVSQSFGKQRQATIKTLKKDNVLLVQMSAIAAMPNAKEFVERVLEVVNSVSGVELRSVSVTGHIEEGVYVLRLSGVAVSRSVVVNVKEVLAQDDDIVIAKFPINNLTIKNGEYNFIIEIETKKEVKKEDQDE